MPSKYRIQLPPTHPKKASKDETQEGFHKLLNNAPKDRSMALEQNISSKNKQTF